MDENKEKDRKNKKDIVNAGIAGASSEVVQRYGSAVKEHLAAYSGVDNENAVKMTKGLKKISEYNVNPNDVKRNLKQQAGFSAEIKETANTNAENIIKGSKIRKVRTDDLGSVNDPIFDFKEVDKNGKIIADSGTQMKFVGSDPEEALKKLAQKKYEKYRENNVKIEVPADFYDGIKEEADQKIKKLKGQIEDNAKKGNIEQVKKKEEQLRTYEKIKEDLKKSSVSNEDAMFARKHPELSTAKSVAKISHGAGKKTAEYAVVIGGSVTIVKNIAAVIKGEEEVKDAVINVAKDTGSTAAEGYITGFAGTTIKGLMQNAKSSGLRNLSGTNFAATAVAVTMSVKKTMGRYFRGEINGVECFEELGKEGTGMLSSALFAAVGEKVAGNLIAKSAGMVLGGLAGGMLGYAVASASYEILLNALKEAERAHEERIQIEKECEEQIHLIREYRTEIEMVINQYLSSNMEIFHNAFDEIKRSLNVGDVDGFISGTNAISVQLGREPQFSDFDEFEKIMESDVAFKV